MQCIGICLHAYIIFTTYQWRLSKSMVSTIMARFGPPSVEIVETLNISILTVGFRTCVTSRVVAIYWTGVGHMHVLAPPTSPKKIIVTLVLYVNIIGVAHAL